LNEEKCAKSNSKTKKHYHCQNNDIGDIDVITFTLCLIPNGKPLSYKKNEDRTDNECGDGMPSESVDKLFPFWGPKIFLLGHQPIVSEPPAIEISDGCMMSPMGGLPFFVGCECDDSGDIPEDCVGFFR
jgi:hypothetical protein